MDPTSVVRQPIIDDARFPAIWNWLQTETAARSKQFAAEWDAAWDDLASLLHTQATTFESLAPSTLEQARHSSLRRLMGDTASGLLFEPAHAFRKSRPQERALTALENYRTGTEDLVRRLPQTIAVSGQELLETLPVTGSRLRRFLLGRRRHPVQLSVRAIVERHFILNANARIGADGAFLLALAKGSLLLLAPWQAIRHEAIRWPPRPGAGDQTLSEDRARWQERSSYLEGEANEASRNIGAWCSGVSERLAQALLLGETRLSPRQRRRSLRYTQTCFRFWSRQQRAVKAVVDLEFEMANVAIDLTAACEQGLESLDKEQSGLLEELENVTRWLQEAQTAAPRQSFPPPTGRACFGRRSRLDLGACGGSLRIGTPRSHGRDRRPAPCLTILAIAVAHSGAPEGSSFSPGALRP